MSKRRREQALEHRLQAARRKVAWLVIGTLALMAFTAWVMWGAGGLVAQALVLAGLRLVIGGVGWVGAWIAGEWPADSVQAILRYTAAVLVIVGGAGVAWRFWRELEGEARYNSNDEKARDE